MKLFCLATALFFLALPAYAQSVTVTYDIISKNNNPNFPPTKAVLTDNGTLSKFLVQLPTTYASMNKPSEGLVKDKRASLYYSEEGVRTRYFVTDSLHTMKWRLTAKNQTILGYPCLSATTTFRGRTYTAYYTLKLPIANGPWKLGGLPGLILAAKTDDGYLEWRATNVTQGNVPAIDLAKAKARKNLDWNTFVANYKEAVLRQTKYIRSQGTIPDDSEVRMLIPSLEIFYPELQTGKGLSY